MIAVNANTGKLAWENRIVDYRENPAQESSGPLIAVGKIFSTRGCDPRGGPDACVITGHGAKTGKEVWRLHTIPKPANQAMRDGAASRMRIAGTLARGWWPASNIVVFKLGE